MTDAEIQASPAPSWQKTVMTALADYGAYVEDTDGSQAAGIDIMTQAPDSWTDIGQPNAWLAVAQQFGSASQDLVSSIPIPVNELQVVDPCVPEGTCPSAPASSAPVPATGSAPPKPNAPTTSSSQHKHKHKHKHKKRATSKGRHHKHKSRKHKHRGRHGKKHHPRKRHHRKHHRKHHRHQA
jgi:hypothetical protein